MLVYIYIHISYYIYMAIASVAWRVWQAVVLSMSILVCPFLPAVKFGWFGFHRSKDLDLERQLLKHRPCRGPPDRAVTDVARVRSLDLTLSIDPFLGSLAICNSRQNYIITCTNTAACLQNTSSCFAEKCGWRRNIKLAQTSAASQVPKQKALCNQSTSMRWRCDRSVT